MDHVTTHRATLRARQTVAMRPARRLPTVPSLLHSLQSAPTRPTLAQWADARGIAPQDRAAHAWEYQQAIRQQQAVRGPSITVNAVVIG